ncbi:MAG: DUF4191 family protein [Actinobacteria bacterium]|jgi:Domain of unknown function (DUF4191)|nr:DUF4191 family protein [Actinomycetota bacterium]NBO50941.1 DUF4191 family protein [Actinomycetota bacterium]NBQ59741.1 DUF4191 family protein [Actinomycetota bacterium]NBY82597.1 DUF4191 family protein [Actinomycetota bacterium]NCA25864.1 DUF4191 family protein [Actinomycetota bacterium]
MFGRKKKQQAQSKTGTPEKQSQLAVVKDAYKLVKKNSPLAIIWCLLVFVLIITFGVIIGNNLGHPIYAGFLSLPLGFLAAFFLFTRYANTAAFSSIEGQIGAGASVLMSIRRGFVTTPAVNVNRDQDMVHRVSGKAGIILVGEGGFGVKSLMQDERRKMERFLSGVPVTEVIVGDGSGQVSIRKLQKHLKKLPKKLSTVQLREVRARLKSVGGLNIPMPKGPMPTNVRMPRR